MKICIIGPSGAGKTTIAAQLAKELSLSIYEFDTIYWDITGNEYRKNSKECIKSKIDMIVNTDEWIVEGAYDKHLYTFLLECSIIFRVNVPYYLRFARLIKRFLIAKITRKKPKETILNTFELLHFSRKYDQQLNDFLNLHKKLSSKVILIKDISSCREVLKLNQ
ncbi:AAA family ATPase [Xenorhabdus sp. KJ12.1]|uniref:AAA family ATPase n=1 Tax=Xenorhabdus sp. KJ12.1 TaxID=1851571 RepID=UPI000C03DA9F|nr:AAA family ATPase [Xenorhabdus sp. KJ12.1]PHM72412.1 ATPase AAA [Xenorhabdus sp. KJ12.1]